jgi:hypothetical protein
MPDPPPGRGIRDGTRGEGAPGRRCTCNSRLTGAPTRRLKVSIPHFFSLEGAPVVVPEGWRRRPPGRSGPSSRRAKHAWRAPTGAGAVPSPRVPGGPDSAPSGEGMGREYKRASKGVNETARIFFFGNRRSPDGAAAKSGASAGAWTRGPRIARRWRSIRATTLEGTGRLWSGGPPPPTPPHKGEGAEGTPERWPHGSSRQARTSTGAIRKGRGAESKRPGLARPSCRLVPLEPSCGPAPRSPRPA